MSFSPQDIEEKEFLVNLRGYDKEEVRAFLRAVASDYRDVQRKAGTPGQSSPELFEALGTEVTNVLRVAQEAADGMRRKAEEEVGALRQKGEAEAQAVRESAASAAKRMRDQAERYGADIRSRADREASERLGEVKRRVDLLQSTEQKVRQRLHALESTLQALRQDLDEDETLPGAETAPEDKVPARSEGASEGEEEAEPSEEKSDSQIRAV